MAASITKEVRPLTRFLSSSKVPYSHCCRVILQGSLYLLHTCSAAG